MSEPTIYNLDETFPVDGKELKQRGPTEDDYDQVIGGTFDAFCGGHRIMACKVLEHPHDLIETVKETQYSKDYRTSGMKTHSRIFGFRPREPLRKDFCSVTSLARAQPQVHGTYCRYAEVVEDFYKEKAPAIHAHHREIVEENILPQWRIGDTLFTSGIVNKNNPLNYHKDNGNYAETWNGMITLANDVAGGMLVIPELRVAVEFKRPAVIIFNARDTWHGVTPIRPMNPRGYRYTIVYYTLKGMANCGTKKEELNRIRKIKTERENRRTTANRDEMEKRIAKAGGMKRIAHQNVHQEIKKEDGEE